MKRLILLTGLLIALQATTVLAGKCSGDKSCTACKNCRYCKHCSKDGGTCGVCKPARTSKKK